MNFNPNQILSIGTQVVTSVDIKNSNGDVLFVRGVVGIITKSPVDATHAYRIRFMDGTETALQRREFTIRRHFLNPQMPDSYREEDELYQYVIFRCITGSRAYGLDEAESDTDRRGFYLPPAELHWSLYGVPEQLEHDERQECYWEVQKFIMLALKGNPNILECLYTPLIEMATPIASELIAMRSIFLCRLIYQTYNGYVMSQFKKLNHHINNHGTIKWKHAMHLIRLLIAGTTALREQYIPVRVEEYREQLLAIRRGELTWEAVNEWRLELHKAFDAAYEKTNLPERPDYEVANAFLVRARRSVVP